MKLKIPKKIKFNFKPSRIDLSKSAHKFLDWIAKSKWFAVFAIIIFLLGINVFSNQFFFRLDFTQDQIYSLSPATRQVITDVDEQVIIKAYFSDNPPAQLLQVIDDIRGIAQEYERYSDNVDFKRVDPGDSDFANQARAAGVREVQFNEFSEDRFEVATGFFGLAIEAGEDTEAIPLITEVSNLEYELTLAILRLTNEDKPQIAYISDNGTPPLASSYQEFRESLDAQFAVEEFDLSQAEQLSPENYAATILASPRQSLSAQDQLKLEQYMLNGGKLMVLADQFQLQNQGNNPILTKVDNNLPEFLAAYGIDLEEVLVLDESYVPLQSGFQQVAFPYWVRAVEENINDEIPALNGIESVALPWPNSVSLEEEAELEMTPLVESTENAWVQNLPEGIEQLPLEIGRYNPGAPTQKILAASFSGKATSQYDNADEVEVEEVDGDSPEEQTQEQRFAGEFISSSEEARIIVIADSEFLSSDFLQLNAQNLSFAVNLVEWFTNANLLSDLSTKVVSERPLAPTSATEKNLIRFAVTGLTPVALIALGLAYNYRRNKKPSRF